jgi:hypothetical protein
MTATMTKEVPTEIFCVEEFIAHVNKSIEMYWSRCQFTHDMPIVRAEILSDKWIRLNNLEWRDGEYKRTSVYCFVARQNYSTKMMGDIIAGGIYKAAGFKVPAKHARGNVFDMETYKCAGPHGVAYLK